MTTAITDVRVVLPDTITDNATVVIDEGRIAEITTGTAPAGARSGHGALLLPGLVDSHSDGLEKEIAPRQTVRFPLDYGLRSFESRVRSAGITTICHGVSYQEKVRAGRSVERARETVAAIAARSCEVDAGVDHRVLYRFEARDPEALTPLLEDLGSSPKNDVAPLLSFEDHTPGQGQFRDIAQYEAAVDPTTLPEGETVQSYVARLKAEGDAMLASRHHHSVVASTKVFEAAWLVGVATIRNHALRAQIGRRVPERTVHSGRQADRNIYPGVAYRLAK